MGNLSMKKTDGRENRHRRLMQATGESTVSGAIDVAAKHYLADLKAKERVAEHVDELKSAEVLEELSNPWIPIEREVSINVGRTD